MKSICLVISDSQDLQGEFGIVGLLQKDFIPPSPAVHFRSLVWRFQSICTIVGHIFVFFITEANKYKSVTAGSLCLRFNFRW